MTHKNEFLMLVAVFMAIYLWSILLSLLSNQWKLEKKRNEVESETFLVLIIISDTNYYTRLLVLLRLVSVVPYQ